MTTSYVILVHGVSNPQKMFFEVLRKQNVFVQWDIAANQLTRNSHSTGISQHRAARGGQMFGLCSVAKVLEPYFHIEYR